MKVLYHEIFRRCGRIFPLALVTLLIGNGSFITGTYADEAVDSSKEITTLFRAARKVISANQGLINEQRAGKTFTAEYVEMRARKNFTEATNTELDLENDARGAKAAMLAAVTNVMDSAQDLINDPNVGFKGFLPAIFARQVATAFGELMEGEMKIKLTAPKKYVRNRANRPDQWEANVIDGMFADAAYEKGKPFYEEVAVKGRAAFRYILPEYYGQSCLSCHGEPRGALDITGGKKEGGKLNELGGAISLITYR